MDEQASIGTGPQGQRAHRKLLQGRPPLEPRVLPILPGVWTVAGLSVANAHVIQTSDGLVVVDSGNSLAEGEAILQMIRTVSSAPVAAIIYTHHHYVHGAKALLVAAQGPVPILAHPQLPANAGAGADLLAPTHERRHRAQYGVDLPLSGPDAATSRPSFYHGPSGYVPPNLLVRHHGQQLRLAGLPLVAYTEYPWDTTDCLILWLPEQKLVLHNHLTANFPNVYSLTGGRFRDPLPWLAGLKQMLALEPEHLLGVHGAPISGRDNVRERLAVACEALQFLVDQTVAGLNAGLTADELVMSIQLPAHLAQHPALQQTYGEVAHHIRAICGGLIGWFDGDAVNLHTVPPSLEAEQIVKGFGGVERVLAAVRQALADGQWAWAAKLARYAVRFAPVQAEPKQLLAQALRELAYRATAWSTRNYCLTQARQLEAQAGDGRLSP